MNPICDYCGVQIGSNEARFTADYRRQSVATKTWLYLRHFHYPECWLIVHRAHSHWAHRQRLQIEEANNAT